MRSPPLLRAALGALVAALALGLTGQPASAHNTFVSSEPASGAELASAPDRISFVFATAVPLDTASAQLIDATGARTELTGLAHGPAGDTEVVAALPTLSPGTVTVRWRLVGPDGHPLTDRVTFTVRAPAAATTTAPAGVAATPSSTTPPTTASATVTPDAEVTTTPTAVRWSLRLLGYVALIVLVGIVLVERLIWPGAATHRSLNTALRTAGIVTAAVAVLQLLVIASDVAGGAPGLDDVVAAAGTDAGTALVLRALLAVVAGALLLRVPHAADDIAWTVLALTGAGLLATWSFAGHAASQRWPHVGVVLDVVHHLAAALWLGGLAVVGVVGARHVPVDDLRHVFRRLSRWAATAVVVLAITGVGQAVRLVGSPARLFDAGHSRLLAVKVLVVVAMLAVANVNRRRVGAQVGSTELRAATVTALRRGIAVELAVGLVVIGITAALVVSPPAAGA